MTRETAAAGPVDLSNRSGKFPESFKGRFFWNKRTGDDLRKSVEYLEQAIANDPGYALLCRDVSE